MIPLIFANVGIPYFAAQTFAGVLLLIPVIIIEAVLLKLLLKRKWWESFKLCTIANLLSTLAGICFIFIEGILYSSTGIIVAIILFSSFLGALLLSIWLEYAVYKLYWTNILKSKLLIAVAVVNIATYIPLIFFAFYIHAKISTGRVEMRRLSCLSNLKSIGLAFKQYAMDYDGWLPDKSGAEGLEQLRSTDYLTDHGVYLCPSTTTQRGKGNQPLTNEIVDYIYQAGLQDPPVDGKDSSKIPVIWDKPTNHENYGNVLFLDGHVKGFEGKDWMEQAGIKENTKQRNK